MSKLTVSDDNATQLVFRPVLVEDDVEGDQHPRQPRSLERQDAQEAQARVRVAPAPDVHQGRTDDAAQKGLAEQRRDGQRARRRVRHQPAKVCHARRALLQHARVSLDEEDVKEEVEGERAEVDECGEESPVL